jgi:hypothetical protein
LTIDGASIMSTVDPALLEIVVDTEASHRPGMLAELGITYSGPEESCCVSPALLVVTDESGGPREDAPRTGRARFLDPSPKGRTSLLEPLPQKQPRRRLIMPIIDSERPSGGETHFTMQPAHLFRGKRLIVECAKPMCVGVMSFRVGNREQFAGPGAVPAALLTAETSPVVSIDTANPYQRLATHLLNYSAEPITVRVAVEGIQLKEAIGDPPSGRDAP